MPVNEKSLANLKPFRPGQSGNPAGRPRNVLSKALRRKLDELDPDAPDAKTKADAIADKLVSLALAGNLEAIKIVLDRMEGRARQPVTVTVGDRERVEQAVESLIATAREHGDLLTRHGALEALAEFDELAAVMLAEES